MYNSMKKHFTIIALALIISIGSQAKERTAQQKRQLALSVLNTNTPTRAEEAGSIEELKTMKTLTVMGYADGRGFAVISNDDRHEAVLGWSDGQFNADRIPDGLKWWLDMANAVLESGNDYTRTVTPATVGDNSLPESVESFVPTRWGQGDPYNRQCPNMGGARAVTGCVATAAAQIMYYYGYPTTGAGDPVFDPISFDFVDFANTTYDYGNMIDIYSDGFTTAQADAVATLMHHCGVATQMSYGTDASGAFSYIAAGAWRDNFRYNTEFYRREVFSTAEWMSIIYNELSNLRPIQYGGADENMGGHSFVFDGYNAEGLVHVNWGWDGDADGYYDVAVLNPQNYQFVHQQEMILMHTPDAPELTYRSQWGIMSGFGVPGSFTVSVDGNALTYIATYLLQTDSDPFMGQLALMCEPADGGATTVLDANTVVDENGEPAEVQYTDGYGQYGNIIDISGLADGTYYLYLASKATSPVNETEWQPIHYGESVNGRYTLTISGGNASVSTGIDNITVSPSTDNDRRIYSVDGRYLGTDETKLGKGLYIRDGKKFIKR